MRVFEINGGVFGSTGRIMFGIADTAAKHGITVQCASPITSTNRTRQPKEPYYQIGTFNSRRLNVLMGRISGFNDCFSWSATRRLINKIEEFNPNLIHLHNMHNCYLNLGMLFKFIKARNIPVVWTLHDCWAFTGQCPYFEIVNCKKWKEGCNNCPQYKEYPATIYDNSKKMWDLKKKWFSGLQTMTIVTPSVWLADLAKQSFLNQYQIKIVNNGIDLNQFKPTISSFKEKNQITGKKVLLGVSFAWGKRKGLDVFVELSKRLDDQYQIILVGTDDEIDKQLPDNIISIHRTQNQIELAEIYTAADVFVNPTREENYPTVNMEAISCGTPIVTFKTGGSPEIIDDTTGIVVECEDIEGMEKAIKSICQKKEIYYQNCLVKSKYFDMYEKFERYIDIYENSFE